jgi:cyclase
MKIRVIPTILTDGLTVVKGDKFDNWRTVGNAQATALLYASRDVDELLFLDVTARDRETVIELSLLNHFSSVLDIPFSVGGGISSLEEAKSCFRNGAEKIVLGTSAISNPKLITEIADVFGSQAVIVAMDFESTISDQVMINSGKAKSSIDAMAFIENLENLGAGEILLQSCEKDGTMSGFDLDRIRRASSLTKLPVIAGSGGGSEDDFVHAVKAGASAVSAGAVFQFTQITPSSVRAKLSENGIRTRIL